MEGGQREANAIALKEVDLVDEEGSKAQFRITGINEVEGMVLYHP